VIDALRFSIDIQLGTQELEYYLHAKDNAISSLGKVLKYQSKYVSNTDEAITYWLKSLPLEADLEEAKIMNEFLADTLISNYAAIFGANNSRVGIVIKILSK
jgi:hypothetical protein